MTSRLRDNGLAIVFGLMFVAALAGQALTGMSVHNEQAQVDGQPTYGLLRYLSSSDFAVDVAENWQSEYLQFFLFIVLTVWLVQRGSPESKPLNRAGRESDEDQKVAEYARADSPPWARRRDWRLAVYSRSLGLVMGGVFVASLAAQAVAGQVVYNRQQVVDGQQEVSLAGYAASAEFWNRTLQNWQSEFLAVASIVVLSIYLRERGSPESKPVGTPHTATGVQG